LTDQSRSLTLCRIGGLMKSKKKTKAKKWVDKPARKPKKIKLPKFELPTSVKAAKEAVKPKDRKYGKLMREDWEPPKNLEDAAKTIKKLEDMLRRGWDHWAYHFGTYFLWVKDNVKHGEFRKWIDDNVRLAKYRTCRYFMDHAEKCDKAGIKLEYHPSVSRRKIKSATIAFLKELVPDGPGPLDATREVSKAEAIQDFAKQLSIGDKPMTSDQAASLWAKLPAEEKAKWMKPKIVEEILLPPKPLLPETEREKKHREKKEYDSWFDKAVTTVLDTFVEAVDDRTIEEITAVETAVLHHISTYANVQRGIRGEIDSIVSDGNALDVNNFEELKVKHKVASRILQHKIKLMNQEDLRRYEEYPWEKETDFLLPDEVKTTRNSGRRKQRNKKRKRPDYRQKHTKTS
jgi:hypothetical protein